MSVYLERPALSQVEGSRKVVELKRTLKRHTNQTIRAIREIRGKKVSLRSTVSAVVQNLSEPDTLYKLSYSSL